MRKLLTDIKSFCSRFHMAETTFGAKAVNDGKFVGRLEKGGQCLPDTEKKARKFMKSYRSAAR